MMQTTNVEIYLMTYTSCKTNFFFRHIPLPVIPAGLKIMADQGFAFHRPLLIPPSRGVPLLRRLRKLVYSK